MSELEQVKDKLKKLINKEESARQLGNLAEAEAFASKIQELLLKYELDIHQLKNEKDRTTSDINKERVDLNPLLSPHEADWVYLLYAVAAENNFCKVIYPALVSYPYLTLIGDELNREFTHYMVNQLVSKLRELARRSFKEYHGPDKRNTYIRSFLKGAVHGIAQRLRKDRERAVQNQPQVQGLVVSKGARLALFMKEAYPPGSLGQKRARSASSADGYASGIKAGAGVSINKGMGGSNGGTKFIG